MRPRIDPPAELLRLAELQDGVLTREQAQAHGLGRHSLARLVDDGHWRRITRGVFVTTSGEPSWLAKAWAGVLIGGDRARLGGLAAAHLAGLVDGPPDRILVLTEDALRRRDRDVWVFRRESAGVRSPSTHGSPPRTRIEDTVLDLCDGLDNLGARIPASPTHWVTTAIERRLTRVDRLRRALAERPRMRQRATLEALLSEVDEGARSVLELAYLRDVERAHGLPRGERQQVRAAGALERGRRAFRDVVYRDYGLVVELDGRLGHEAENRIWDLRRDNVTTLRGERTLRYGWVDVHDEPCVTAFQVARGLQAGGWTGIPTRCSRCQEVPDAVLAELSAG